MRRALPMMMLTSVALAMPTAVQAATIDGTYKGTARSTDGKTVYGRSTFTIKKGKLVSWSAEMVPRQCRILEQTNFGFIVASNVLRAYGLKAKDVKLSNKGRLKFTYRPPSHLDSITVNVKFTNRRASGTLVDVSGPGEPSTLNCSGSARMTMKK